MKKFCGFVKYWYTMYSCVGLAGILWMSMWPNKGGSPDYVKVWEMHKDKR